MAPPWWRHFVEHYSKVLIMTGADYHWQVLEMRSSSCWDRLNIDTFELLFVKTCQELELVPNDATSDRNKYFHPINSAKIAPKLLRKVLLLRGGWLVLKESTAIRPCQCLLHPKSQSQPISRLVYVITGCTTAQLRLWDYWACKEWNMKYVVLFTRTAPSIVATKLLAT